MRLRLLLGLLTACTPVSSDSGLPIVTLVDADGDGFTDRYDCDDDDATIHPGADELCDGVDNDCDDRVDEDAIGAATWYIDQDRDGWGDPLRLDEAEVACNAPVDRHYAARVGDCDDGDAGVNPDALEVCGDRIDNDCDGLESENDENTDPDSLGVWYLDLDGDGFGGDASTLQGCTRPEYEPEDTGDSLVINWASAPGDCDDGDSQTYPGAGWREDDPEVAAACVRDADSDGFGDATAEAPVTAGTDCNDQAAWIYLSSRIDLEICDGADSNCNGGPADDEEDKDADGYVGCDLEVDLGAWLGSSTVVGGGDCDDADPLKSPAADELCNGVDDDCDGLADESDAIDRPSWYIDTDSDGYGDPGVPILECNRPTGYVDDFTDCDDSDGSVNPGEDERCLTPGVDDDCDGTEDEADAIDHTTWYQDLDSDGYGSINNPLDACFQPSGYVASSEDCNDINPEVNPDATEVCNSTDDDCDGDVDGDDASVVGDLWYYDQDGDSFGNPNAITRSCTAPNGYVSDDQDCDDGDADVNPDATEICRDEADNDCNDSADSCDLSVSGTLAAVDAVFTGDAASLGLGASFHGVPDVDGDSVREVLIGLPGDDTNATDAGAVWLAYGPASGAASSSSPDALYSGNVAGYRAGSAVISAATLAGGAEADLGFGSCPGSSASDSAGSMHFFFDLLVASDEVLDDADLVLPGQTSTAEFGCTAAMAGDQDGDSAADLIVGAPGTSSSAGAVWVIYGPLSSNTTLFNSASAVTGVTASDRAGAALAAGHDVDGDGNPDLLVGAPGASSTRGRAYLMLGPVSQNTGLAAGGVAMVGQTVADDAGTSVALGDFDDDGYADILIGAPGDDDDGTDAGAAYMLFGPVTQDRTLGLADAKLTGGAAGALAGTAVANAGDLDSDGIDDMVIGAPAATSAGVATGAVFFLPGGGSITGAINLSTDVSGQYVGAAAGDLAGQILVGVGDVSGDGWADVVVGAPGVDGSATDVGAAYILWGNGY